MKVKQPKNAAEHMIDEKKIGERIRRLRLKKSMGLVELGKHTGLSASFLSQLENGRVVPTIKNLARIAMVFSKDLSYFFEEEPKAVAEIHPQQERVRLPEARSSRPAYFFESLGYKVPDRSLDPYWAEFQTDVPENRLKPHSHPGFEFLFVIKGRLELRHADQKLELSAGDSICFDSSVPHSYFCVGDKKAEAVIVVTERGIEHQDMHSTNPASMQSTGSGASPRLMSPISRTTS